MPSPIQKVLLIGAGGNLGPAILDAVLASPSNFTVTALTRPESKSTFPSAVKVVKSDYTPQSLEAAFKGQDAVVSIIGGPGMGEQQKIVDAAVAAGVKRFLPSEFGLDNSNEAFISYASFFHSNKHALMNYLVSKESHISWTAIPIGAFFDWGIEVGFLGFDLTNKRAELWDGGDVPFAATRLATVGNAVAASLGEAYEKTKNQWVYIAEYPSVTQKDILASLEKATGSKWDVTNIDSAPLHKAAREKLDKGDLSELVTLIKTAFLSKDIQLGRFEKVWNEELGLRQEDFDDAIRAVVNGSKHDNYSYSFELNA